MADQIRHRGPDNGGGWADPAVGVALGSRRLAIIDLSPQGHQPMVSGSGRYVIAFNGEIYNHLEIRRILEAPSNAGLAGAAFRGHSDTEVLLAAIDRWGLQEAIRHCTGMFAFALWDREERALHLVRDRIGEKPLYYGWSGNVLLFGSELKALRAHPAWQGEVDRNVLALFIRYNYVPAPYSIYKGIYKAAPGTVLTFDKPVPTILPRLETYWSIKQVAQTGELNPFNGSDAEAVDQLEAILGDSISHQMVADVPVGAFLSGGVDSSTVVALMQQRHSNPIKTFTIGFKESAFNEAVHAQGVARHLGTDHTELYVTPAEAMGVIPMLPSLYDEPFADSSQIPMLLVSQLARESVTVSLSGDGGDELFAGYHRYHYGKNIWEQTEKLPVPVRKGASLAINSLSPERWDAIMRIVGPAVPSALKPHMTGDRLHKLAKVLPASSPEQMYRKFVSEWENPVNVVLGAKEPMTNVTNPEQWSCLKDFVQRMTYLDIVSYLPDDILVKVDRASMGVSLEARVPFLDHRVVEFSATLPPSMKTRDGQGKWLLRQLLYRHVPKALIERPKWGFGVPVEDWIRGPLLPWASSYLNEQSLRESGFFDPAPILKRWNEHLSGKRNWVYALWSVLMFQSWLESQARN